MKQLAGHFPAENDALIVPVAVYTIVAMLHLDRQMYSVKVSLVVSARQLTDCG